MPYKNIEINQLDTVYQQAPKKNHFYKGFSSINNPDIGNRLFDLDLIKQDIINQFNTRKGERVMNPQFGSIIWDLLMEPLTESTTDALKEDIQTIISADPRVTPSGIKLNEYDNGYLLELTLTLVNTDQSTNLRLAFDQKLGLVVQ
jgi:phage baseplate assembly protein W